MNSADKNIADAIVNQKKFAAQLTENWIPTNPIILKDIRHKIKNKNYKTSKELLFDARRDCSLFSYLLLKTSQNSDGPVLEKLTTMPLNRLEALIPAAASNVSKLDLSKILDHQVKNLRLLVIASSAVQTLALYKALDPDRAYLTSILRVLGLSFASWNHSHIYSRMLDSNDGYLNLDSALLSKLTYSPTSIFINHTLDWELPCEIYWAALKDNIYRAEEPKHMFISPIDTGNLEEISELAAICRIAESLAIASIISGTTLADKLWNNASQEIDKIIGPAGLELIEENINSLWSDYSCLFSGWYTQIFSSSGAVEDNTSDYGKKFFHNNTHILQCKPEIQKAFAEIYKQMTDVNTAAGAFHTLVTDLIPSSGFLKGGVYIVDRPSMKVSPLMMMAASSKADYKPAYLFNKHLDLDPMIKSLMSGTIVKGRVTIEGKEIIYISGAIGAPPDQIIVYLETSHEPFLTGEADATACFKAVQQCILDSVMNN